MSAPESAEAVNVRIAEHLNENDKKELDKFRHYLRARADWDAKNKDAAGTNRIKAYCDIYENIYGISTNH